MKCSGESPSTPQPTVPDTLPPRPQSTSAGSDCSCSNQPALSLILRNSQDNSPVTQADITVCPYVPHCRLKIFDFIRKIYFSYGSTTECVFENVGSDGTVTILLNSLTYHTVYIQATGFISGQGA